MEGLLRILHVQVTLRMEAVPTRSVAPRMWRIQGRRPLEGLLHLAPDGQSDHLAIPRRHLLRKQAGRPAHYATATGTGRKLVVKATTSTVREGSFRAELLNLDDIILSGFTRDDFEE